VADGQADTALMLGRLSASGCRCRCHNSLPPNKGNELEDDDEMVQKSGIVEESHIHTTT
jgi:hypothetical protein